MGECRDLRVGDLVPSSSPRTRVAVLVLALVFPSLMAWSYFVALAKPAAQSEANLAVQILYGAGKVLQFTLPVLAVLVVERRWPRPAPPHFRGLGTGLAFGVVVAIAILVLYSGVLRGTHYFRETPAKLSAKLQEFDLATPAGYVLLALFISVVHSLFEEYYWRWYVFRNLEQLLPLGWAVVVSALGFMAHHVIVLAVYFPGRFFSLALPLSLCIAGGGVVWAWLYHQSGSIYSPWLSHMLIDASIMVVGYDLMFHSAA
jgi:membrane protease YdiL (CAAX protease family)